MQEWQYYESMGTFLNDTSDIYASPFFQQLSTEKFFVNMIPEKSDLTPIVIENSYMIGIVI